MFFKAGRRRALGAVVAARRRRDRLNHIDEPVVPTKPSKYALPANAGGGN